MLDAASGMDLSIDFLLDDMIRTDEIEMALAWERQLQAFGLPYQRVDYNFEKGGLLLATENLSDVDTTLAQAEDLNLLQRIAGLEEESSRLEAIFKSW